MHALLLEHLAAILSALRSARLVARLSF
jgi:hypothetical protein